MSRAGEASRGEGPARGVSAASLRAELAREGFHPSKERGQNFLVDPNLARALVRDAGVQQGDRVLEVGPGCGFLTEPLAELGVELVAVEIDPVLARIASRRVREHPNARVLVGDVLEGKHRLGRSVREALGEGEGWHLVSNLPYGLAGPLVGILVALDEPPRSLSMVVQREVAERFAATPGGPAWSALGMKIRLRYLPRLGRPIPASMFWPRPRVESRQVRLELRSGPGVPGPRARALGELADALFQHRRKTLGRGLSTALGDSDRAQRALAVAGVEPRRRPQELAVEELQALLAALEGPRT